jgi:LPS-assembly protein
MYNGGKFNLKYRLAFKLALLLFVLTLFAGRPAENHSDFYKSLTPFDTTPASIKKTATLDTTPQKQRVDTLSVKISKDSLDGPVEYAASDSMVLLIPDRTLTLYNKANTKYQDINLDAYKIEVNQQKQTVVATYALDSAGEKVGKPHFVQGENNMESDSITYNFKTQKGLTKSTYTNQGEMFVYGDRVKKVSPDTYFGMLGRFTTCNLDEPHFSFRTQKLKLVNKKLAVTGPIHPEFEGVPVPIYLPFGMFPLTSGRHSGFLPPQFSANDQFGLGLEGMGYYKVLNDNFDVMLRADVYSYGGWRATLTPTYIKRYRYRGQMNLSVQNTRILSNSAEQEFITNRSFMIGWNHTADMKARPGTLFSANVQAGSTKFNQYTANNPLVNFQNQLNSAITYQKNWGEKYNLTLSAGHDQNNITRLINIRLPNGSFTVNNFFPFQPKEMVGESKWYEKFGIGLNSQFAGQTSFYDSLFNFRQLIDTFQWGVQHAVPITLALPQLGPIQIAPGISYQQRWYAQEFYRRWNVDKGKVDTTINKGFYTAHDIAFSLGLNTAIFGTFSKFGKNSSVQAIRHVMRPNLSASFKPDLARRDFYETQIDTVGNKFRFSRFDGSIYGPFSEGTFGGLSFGLDNNLEMKARSKRDSAAEVKKVKILDGFGFNGSYNFLADSFQLSTISIYARSTILEKINITANAILDPYVTDNRGFRRDILAWQNGKGFSLGSITSGNIAISTQFASKKKDEKEKMIKEARDNNELPLTMEEQQAQLNYIRSNPGEFADFDIPWSVNLSFSLSYNRLLKPDYSGFTDELNSSINISGDFNLTPKWKLGLNTFYDFRSANIQQLTMFLSREMHCWQMSINVNPVGLYKFFNITINPKSSMLRDLRVNRTRYFYGGT